MFSFINGNTNLLLDNLSNKRVLVLGSGPSAREVDWAKENWDVLVTTSFFYLNTEVVSKKPAHVTLSDIVDLTDDRLLNYFDINTKCTIAFEPKIHPFYETRIFKEFIKKYQSRIIFYNIEGGKEGVAGRACWLVLSCNPEKLYICGIDGVSKDRNSDPKNYFRNHIGTADSYTYEDYLKSFQEFGKNIYDTGKKMNIPIINLGKGKPYNMISNLSYKYEI